MVLDLEDIACFVASWDPKPEQVRRVARELNLGLDALVFVDDNPAEAEAIRQLAPRGGRGSVAFGSGRVRPNARCHAFVRVGFLHPGRLRAHGPVPRSSEARQLEESAGSVEEFLASLGMEATLAEFDDVDMPRIAQLVGKTNQFNLTARRHSQAALESFRDDPAVVTMSARLRDRFADHGLIAVLVAEQRDDSLVIDTWLMSCRVIGRDLEQAMLNELAGLARARGCKALRGIYVPSARNQLVADLYERLGFSPATDEVGDGGAGAESTSWSLELDGVPPGPAPSIEVTAARSPDV